jgi:Mn-dependent DtxR family transcriptional regulator
MPATAPDDLRVTMDRFLVVTYDEQRANGYAVRIGLDTLSVALAITPALVGKIAQYLEREGLLEFEHDLVDLTVEGILRAESIARDAARAPEPTS